MINLYSNQSTPVLYDTMTTIQESHLTTCNSCIKQLAMTSGDKGEHCNLQSRHYLLAIFFLFCGVLLSSLNQSSAPQHVEGPLPRPAWLADLYTLSLASSRVVLPGDPDYSQVVQVSPGAGAGAGAPPARCHHCNLQVYNGECVNTPDAVVVAGSNQDVSTIVKAVTQSAATIELDAHL